MGIRDSPTGHIILYRPTSRSPSSLRALIQAPDTLTYPTRFGRARLCRALTLFAKAPERFSPTHHLHNGSIRTVTSPPTQDITMQYITSICLMTWDFQWLSVAPKEHNHRSARPLPATSCQHGKPYQKHRNHQSLFLKIQFTISNQLPPNKLQMKIFFAERARLGHSHARQPRLLTTTSRPRRTQ